MHELQCELCRSSDFLKNADGLYQCQGCGCKYTLEQAKTFYKGAMHNKNSDFVVRAGKLERYCGESINVVIPSHVLVIGKNAFNECSALNTVIIPDGVTTIEVGAFGGCKNLKRITIPASVTSIEGYAFSGCESLTEVQIPAGITMINPGVFSECSSLRTVNLPDTLTEISRNAFSRCRSLREITIPNSVRLIREDAFFNCVNLEKITRSSNTHVQIDAFAGTKWYVSQKENERQAWKRQGLCSNCGGRFKGLFSQTCTQCGRKKSY